MNNVTVIVCGTTGSGKSAVLQKIASALEGEVKEVVTGSGYDAQLDAMGDDINADALKNIEVVLVEKNLSVPESAWEQQTVTGAFKIRDEPVVEVTEVQESLWQRIKTSVKESLVPIAISLIVFLLGFLFATFSPDANAQAYVEINKEIQVDVQELLKNGAHIKIRRPNHYVMFSKSRCVMEGYKNQYSVYGAVLVEDIPDTTEDRVHLFGCWIFDERGNVLILWENFEEVKYPVVLINWKGKGEDPKPVENRLQM